MCIIGIFIMCVKLTWNEFYLIGKILFAPLLAFCGVALLCGALIELVTVDLLALLVALVSKDLTVGDVVKTMLMLN